jgi:hypothetical protein
MPLEQGLALGDLLLDALCVAAGGECLAMPVLLMAGGAGGGASGASWMLRVALLEGEQV